MACQSRYTVLSSPSINTMIHHYPSAQLSAENSTPYKLPKERPISGFEKLPLEILHRIYDLSGGVSVRDIRIQYVLGQWCGDSQHEDTYEDYRNGHGLQLVSRQVRADVMAVVFSGVTVILIYPLSGWNIFRENWAKISSMEVAGICTYQIPWFLCR
jgi:hypothetical protein